MRKYEQTKCVCAILLVIPLTLQGCITYKPQPMDRVSFMERAQTQTQDDLTVTVSVLSDKEAKKVFGVNLAKKGVQPVWIKIENRGTSPFVFIPRNLDPNYYSAEEAAYTAHFKQSRQFLEAGIIAIVFFPALALIPVNFIAARRANKKMDALFGTLALPSNIIMPDSEESGFVFTSVDEGTKHVKIDMIGSGGRKTFPFVITVPGIKPDYTTKDLEGRYPDKTQGYQEDSLPRALTAMPRWTTNKKGTVLGDPFNLVVIGDLEDLIVIFTAAGWDETQALTFSSGFKMTKAFITGDSDRYSPVSPLFYNGHSQDIAFQKSRNTINQRLHLRLWYTPLRFEQKPVWIGTISRDIGVKFTLKTWYLTTHKIDPNLDDARDYLLADLAEIQKVKKFGYILQTLDPKRPHKNLTGDPYFTDARLLVMELSTADTPFTAFAWHHTLTEPGTS